MSEQDVYFQSQYRCKLDWGRYGTRRAVERGDILVIVDTLSFSSAVATAINNGGIIYPCSIEEDAAVLGHRSGAEVAVRRRDVPGKGRFSLSPLTYLDIESGTKVVLESINGATCSRYAQNVPYLFSGALLNAKAVATVVARLMDAHHLSVTIIACGERWRPPTEDGELRIAIEDYLGAGAIISYLQQEKSPEARVCEGAFLHSRDTLEELLWESGTGRELHAKGFGADVRHAARLNLHDTVPVMRGDRFEKFHKTLEEV